MRVKNGLMLGIGISLVVLALALTFRSVLVSGHSEVNGVRNTETMMDNYDMDDMDKNGDGICDMCGMNVEDCEGMEEMCGSMMKMYSKEMEEMHKGCGSMMNGNDGNMHMNMMMGGMYNE